MITLLLILAGLYGLSGSLLKMVRSFHTYGHWVDIQMNNRAVSDVNKPNFELTRLLVDYFAFALIGMGFLIGVIYTVDNFSVNKNWLIILFTVQNVLVWLSAYDFEYVDLKGGTKARNISFIFLTLGGIFIVPILVLLLIASAFEVNSYPMLFKLYCLLAMLVPTIQYFVGLHYAIKSETYNRNLIQRPHNFR